jgi:hypothetical protein
LRSIGPNKKSKYLVFPGRYSDSSITTAPTLPFMCVIAASAKLFMPSTICHQQAHQGSLPESTSSPRYAYIAPLYRQAKQVGWDYLKFYAAPTPQTKVNESELRWI